MAAMNDVFHTAHSWEVWDLSGQNLKSLPRDLLTHATSVDLQRNKLKRVIGISRFTNLMELNLSRNKLVEFSREICYLHKLEILYMNQNNIRSIPEGIFPHLRVLKFVKLSTNRLTKLPSDINQCTSITHLDLSRNCLQNIQPLIGLPKLKELLVERNQLTELPFQLFQSGNCELTVCKATGNPLRCPPEEVCAGGVMDIQSYFCQMEENPNTCHAWTVKTMFLGSSMAGKSTLCRSLREGKPVVVAVKDRTEGIEISQLYTQEVRFLLWDFAGQEEYYLTHHVFITPRALVILTIDLARYSIVDPQSFKDQLWFWLNNIQLRVPDSVVLLVGTHCDQCRDQEEVMEKKDDIEEKVKTMLENRRLVLKHQKKNLEENIDTSLFTDQVDELDCLLEYNLKVLDLVTLDCTRTEDIAKLRSHILMCIQSESVALCSESILPKSYEEVEQAIHTLVALEQIPQHGIILLEELSDLILNHVKLSKESLCSILQFLLRYLHRIGVIVWYEDIDVLSDRVFIQPSFLISVFKSIVRHDLVECLEGVSRDHLMQEGALVKQKLIWVDDLRCRGTLHNAAMRILVRRELEKLVVDDDDLIREVVGTKREEGIILTLLQYFEVCLPTLVGSPLDPQAPEFISGMKQWESAREAKRNPDGACLFPMYLKDDLIVCQNWGQDKQDDLRVHVYFLPEIPHGFFHRMIIKTCSLFATHWVGKEQSLFCCGNKLALVRQRNKDEDPFIEIRCRRPEKDEEFRPLWDLILAVMSNLFVLSRQWPGVTHQVHTPCPERGCPHYFTWRDWKELSNTNLYNLVKEEKLVCQRGHTRRTELIFPKVPTLKKGDCWRTPHHEDDSLQTLTFNL
ncbi:malignant fibrous histiocytoma-amplified sequence 1 homolog isoform X2 [Toxotes jaculatrix]|uniref:malignant fibrous histiocytoma-amplified sequence 1 homolog isoform X2 n=1 Tax=Toxotes jaculatrix TaxID=941984 RepID=UPI001B3ABAF9|nr:malignant fibrous histiocytoma-amplified sequence 1 homolog isoform X2 [Toxotes jaculatrix]